MTTEGTPTPTPEGTPAPETPPAAGTPAPTPAPEPAPTGNAPLSEAEIASLDARTQKYIQELRQENAKDRTAAKETAAAEARKTLSQEVAKALGLIEEQDPAAAAKKTADELEAARKVAKAAQVEVAVIKLAAKHGANDEALKDSKSFMDKLTALDPASEDFSAQVEAAIKQAVEANPLLKLAPPAPTRSGGPVGGGAGSTSQLTSTEGMTPEEIDAARRAGRLNAYLGIS